MNRIFSIAILTITIVLTSCGDDKSKKDKPSLDELKASIKQWEDSLTKKQNAGVEVISLDRIELINRCLAIYRNYPESDLAPASLDKVHMIFSGLGAYDNSVAYADTLIKEYPKYINRALVLESQASNYDIFIQPRDSSKVRFYYNLLLKEYPKIAKDKVQGIKDRLKMNQLSFDDYINHQMEMNSKVTVVK